MSEYGLPDNPEQFFKGAFIRNIGILTGDEQSRLSKFKVAIAGVGGVGGFHLMNLVRLGVGRFNISDIDVFELANIQRQRGARRDTIGRPKAEVMRDMALSVNPYLEIEAWLEGITAENADAFLDKADIFIDGIDFFNFDIRRLLFKKARERGIYSVTAGPLGFGSGLLVFSPSGMGFDAYFDIKDGMSYLEKIIAFGVGLAPAGIHLKYLKLKDVKLQEKKGPSLVSACQLCSSLAVTEVIKILLNKKEVLSAPHYCQFDPYEKTYRKGYLIGGNSNPVQKLKRWYLYNKFSKEEHGEREGKTEEGIKK